ncbi:MAG: helix-turn-helix domain-containing protein [Candidatus Gastranaerophilales bacterium]|nr:helix-turn-helix domain-containing protein [Candidatus Gastranaerophilales bacterium]
MAFAETLTLLRENRGVLQKDLADLLGLSVGTISNYEKGIHEPNMSTLSRIADFYGVSTDYLLGQTSNPAPASKMSPEQYQKYENLFLDLTKLSDNNLQIIQQFTKFLHKQELSSAKK